MQFEFFWPLHFLLPLLLPSLLGVLPVMSWLLILATNMKLAPSQTLQLLPTLQALQLIPILQALQLIYTAQALQIIPTLQALHVLPTIQAILTTVHLHLHHLAMIQK